MTLIKLMPRLAKITTGTKDMGAIHLVVLIILALGILVGVWLVQHPAIFKPKADYRSDPSQAFSVNGNQCKNNTCEYDGLTSGEVNLTIDVDGLNSQ